MAKQLRCPTCQQVYAPPETYCQKDGAALQPVYDSAATPTDPLLHQILDGRYRLDRVLGSGATGKVYLAEHVNIRRICAIKVLHKNLLADEEAIRRFQREARAISAIDHPHIVEVYDFGQISSGVPFLVMEYVEGITLRAYLDQSTGGVLPLNQAVPVAMQAAQALQHVHDHGIVHRDIKPDNIQLTIDAEQPVYIKLLDFGLARIKSHAAVTQAMRVPALTTAYAPPELHQRVDTPSPAIDIYALGVTLFEILTKQRPFPGIEMQVPGTTLPMSAPLLSQRRPDLQLPPELDALVARMLNYNPEKRPTAAVVADELAALTPKLRSVSARSLQYLRTYVLPKNQGERPAKSRPPAAARPAPVKRSVTQVLAALQNLDEVEADLEQVSDQLDRECKGLIKRLARLWAGKVPAALAETLQRSSDLEVIKSELELDLALHRDELAREKAALRAERNVVRQQLQSLREELRATPNPSSAGQRQAAAELAQLERAYEASESTTELTARVAREEARRMQLTFELRSMRRELADNLLRAIRELAQGSERLVSREQEVSLSVYVQRLARVMTRFDTLTTALEKFL